MPRLRLRAEPIEEQLHRLKRATSALTIAALGVGLLFVGLFSTFKAPGIGLVIGGLLFGAIVTPAWRSFHQTRRGAEAYQIELGAHAKVGPGGG